MEILQLRTLAAVSLDVSRLSGEWVEVLASGGKSCETHPIASGGPAKYPLGSPVVISIKMCQMTHCNSSSLQKYSSISPYLVKCERLKPPSMSLYHTTTSPMTATAQKPLPSFPKGCCAHFRGSIRMTSHNRRCGVSMRSIPEQINSSSSFLDVGL